MSTLNLTPNLIVKRDVGNGIRLNYLTILGLLVRIEANSGDTKLNPWRNDIRKNSWGRKF